MTLRRIAEALGLREGEAARTGRLFTFIFLMTASIVLAKSAQRGIFLSAYPRTAIPDAFLLSALTLAIASFGMSAIASRIGLKGVVQALLAGGAILLGLSRLWLLSGDRSGPMVVYVLVEGLCSLLLVQGWAVVSEALDVRSAKRLLPLVSVAAGLAWTVGGLSVGALAKRLGAESLLVAVPVLLLCALAALEVIARVDLATKEPKPVSRTSLFGDAVGSLKYIASEPLMKVLATIIALDLLVEQVTDFQMLSTAQEWFHHAPDRIAAFMGAFYGITGALSLLAPFTFSGRVLSRFGSTRSMSAAAGWTFLLALLFFVHPAFALVVLLSGGDRVFKQSLSAPARTQILGAVPAVRRAQAGAVLRGIIGSAFAVAIACGLKLFPRGAPVSLLAPATILGSVVLLGVILGRLRKGYVIALQRTVDRRKLDLDAPGDANLRQLDREQAALLAEELRSQDGERAEFALTILARGDAEVARPLLREALSHPSEAVRAHAVQVLADFGDRADVPAILAALESAQENTLRCSCLRALAALRAAEARPVVERFRDAPDPRVRALASACLARIEDAPGEDLGRFQAMLGSRSEEERAAAAWAMGRVPLAMPEVTATFAPLLDDQSIVVRREAVGAAGWFADLPIVRSLVFALGEQKVAPVAFDAFAKLGDSAVERVELVLRDAPAPVVSRTAAALAHGVGQRTIGLLTHLLEHDDAAVRHRAARALIVQRRSQSYRAPSSAVLMRAIHAELAQGYRYHAALSALAALDGSAEVDEKQRFIRSEVQSRIRQTEERLLALIAVATDPRIARMGAQLRDASPQTIARVVELLEQSIDSELAELVVPFIEQQPDGAHAKRATERFNVPERYLTDPVAGIVDLNDEHLRRCLLLVYRERMAAEYPSFVDRDQPLLHLVERIRFLRSVPLFKELTPEDLMKLAEIAEPVEHVAGHVIFKKGDPGDVLCIVVRGKVEIRDGGRTIAAQGAHEFFGELALFDHEPRSADAVCSEDTELLQIGGPDLDELMERRPEIAREIIRVLARRLRKTTQQMLGSSGQAPVLPARPEASRGAGTG